jgi:uncharacterized membrane protein YgaE (UPF0421/DUF939 family)
VQLSFRAAAAAALSVGIAQALRLQFPIYAMISAVIVTDLSAAKTRRLGVPRFAGTVIGAGLGAALSLLLAPGPLGLALSIMAAMLVSHLLRLQEAVRLSGFVCGIVLLEHDSSPWSYALYRLIETVLGIVVAVLVSLVPKLIRTDEPDGAKP